MTIMTTLAATAAIVLLAAPVSAATWDFVDIADNGIAQEANFGDVFPAGIERDGIVLSASGENSAGIAADAFLDKTDGSGPAGLGVCSSASCASGVPGAITSDDNVSAAGGGIETLVVGFSQSVAIDLAQTLFRGSNHGLAQGDIVINGTSYDIVDGLITSVSSLVGNLFRLSPASSSQGDQFYLSTLTATPVPLPPSLAMLLAALGGMAVLRRRRVAY